jgi:hypothetical protein
MLLKSTIKGQPEIQKIIVFQKWYKARVRRTGAFATIAKVFSLK